MSYDFRTVTIRHRATGEEFPHTNFCAGDDEAVRLARLTFVSALWEIVAQNQSIVPQTHPTVSFQTSLF